MGLTFYGYPKCGTCRNAYKWLSGKGIDVEYKDVFQEAPSLEELRRIVALSGLPVQKLFNTSGDVYRELGLKDKLPSMSDEDKLRLLAEDGRLLKRPVVMDGLKATVGFREEEYELTWAR
ncbi:arsenate reductase family protein [Gorillibacterium sp. sgz5001074]|uniref:arsenate reductase family protein n=1 Tax=Gorillibacterium sp. sgz5001074 TaxID=3446695 RepID=UPI003F675477